mmetsp:Transcript_13071/g.52678  ORF Transcript_13071/g.52678 Transcript_13071/m.52678 type:complete len:214 (-) Transcript_13071:308-949(-)
MHGEPVRALGNPALDAHELVLDPRQQLDDHADAPKIIRRGCVVVYIVADAEGSFLDDLVPRVHQTVASPPVPRRVAPQQPALLLRRAPRASLVERRQLGVHRLRSAFQILKVATRDSLEPQSSGDASEELRVVLAAPAPEPVGVPVRGDEPALVVHGDAPEAAVGVVPAPASLEHPDEAASTATAIVSLAGTLVVVVLPIPPIRVVVSVVSGR